MLRHNSLLLIHARQQMVPVQESSNAYPLKLCNQFCPLIYSSKQQEVLRGISQAVSFFQTQRSEDMFFQ